MCTAQRFHMDSEEQRCRVGCPHEPDSLSHYNECPLLHTFVVAAWIYAAVRPRRPSVSRSHHSDHLRSLQYGIAVHNYHRRNTNNLGNFGDCMEGRIRLMTVITPTYAYAYQSLCPVGRLFVVPHQNFRLPACKARYPNLPNSRTTTREKGNDLQEWAIYTEGGTRLS